MPPPVTTTIADGVAVITLANPPVNALAIPVLEGLERALKDAQANAECARVIHRAGETKRRSTSRS